MAATQPTREFSDPKWSTLLNEAVTRPGVLMQAYSLFWNYSLGNQILAFIQAAERGIPLGPIASFNRWKELGRHVRKGTKGHYALHAGHDEANCDGTTIRRH